ncbi:hypothetical protein L226DRAFT_308813 [Lentinus tigrinus ALCF2SS1-7]|uniref:Uncharacterized protein n=1 Tax=Lentinus tigrinus ALCF2SS1-6 TaxID=1328759 RepID=A0A5C2S4M3_9APHY|nr:hypothetical protein L227DRAFT_199581 [Lentinus tigrinus ALCF2SS1-6]RPD69023.1 hypothetical protein L226DRAFT_308813 [Lentinus tigrinus ALCF2SS1-7]
MTSMAHIPERGVFRASMVRIRRALLVAYSRSHAALSAYGTTFTLRGGHAATKPLPLARYTSLGPIRTSLRKQRYFWA